MGRFLLLKIYFDDGSNSYIFNGCQLTKCSRNEIQPIIQFVWEFREMIYLLALLSIWTNFLAHLLSSFSLSISISLGLAYLRVIYFIDLIRFKTLILLFG